MLDVLMFEVAIVLGRVLERARGRVSSGIGQAWRFLLED